MACGARPVSRRPAPSRRSSNVLHVDRLVASAVSHFSATTVCDPSGTVSGKYLGTGANAPCGARQPSCQSITPSVEGVRPRLSVGSGRVFLGERQPELLLVLDEARQLCAEEWLELRAGLPKSLLQLRIVENLAQAVAQDTHDRLRRPR